MVAWFPCSGLLEFPVANVYEVALDSRRCRHHRTYQVSTAAPSLSSFKVAVAGGGATFSRLQDVGIHSQAHRASGFTPFESSFAKNFVQAFLFSNLFYDL